MIAITSLNPVSVVKVKLQNSSTTVSISEIVRSVYQQRGILGFWSGAQMGLLQAVPSTVLYMTFYERIKAQLSAASVPGSPGVAGGLARCVSVSVISPLELIRTIQTGGSSESAATIARRILKAEGVVGLYRGWRNSILRDAPFSAIYWFSFEFFKEMLLSVAEADKSSSVSRINSLSHLKNFLSGSAAGVVAAVMTHPFDVIKTQQQLAALQVDGEAVAVHGSGAPSLAVASSTGSVTANVRAPTSVSSSAAPTVLHLYQQGGVNAMFRGLTMRLATVIPSSAIMVTVYEAVKNWGSE